MASHSFSCGIFPPWTGWFGSQGSNPFPDPPPSLPRAAVAGGPEASGEDAPEAGGAAGPRQPPPERAQRRGAAAVCSQEAVQTLGGLRVNPPLPDSPPGFFSNRKGGSG